MAATSKAATLVARTPPAKRPPGLASAAAPAAAPAAKRARTARATARGVRAPYAEAVGRLVLMSWNPGAGCRKLTGVIDRSGYHIVAVQEAREDQLVNLSRQRWSYEIKFGQFVGARCPNWVESHNGEETQGRIRWHFATVHFEPQQRVNRSSLGIMSLHLSNLIAKRKLSGIDEMGKAIDKARRFNPSNTVDVICGDINMARWCKNITDKEAANWNEGTLCALEARGYIPVADYTEECCFVAVHESIARNLHIKGSSWGERMEKLSLVQQKAFKAAFNEEVGANRKSKDVHWPMSLAIRMSTDVRASGLRQRTPAAQQRRNEKKRARGILFVRSASSSGSAAPAAQADRSHLDSYSNWYGRSSGSGDWSGRRSESRWYGYGRSSGSGAWSSSGSGGWWEWHSH